eukprot:snap_masked-scaffold_13-processed-gene-11.16-mRNA-1 protein AED:1.00 eAED:1.00 QI:0/0/0/0/1/1/2/0/758
MSSSKLVSLLPYPTLESKFSPTIRRITLNPRQALNIYVLVSFFYIVFLETNYYLIHYLTFAGYLVFLFVSLKFLSRFLTKSIAYPLSTKTVFRELEISIAVEKQKRITYLLGKILKNPDKNTYEELEEVNDVIRRSKNGYANVVSQSFSEVLEQRIGFMKAKVVMKAEVASILLLIDQTGKNYGIEDISTEEILEVIDLLDQAKSDSDLQRVKQGHRKLFLYSSGSEKNPPHVEKLVKLGNKKNPKRNKDEDLIITLFNLCKKGYDKKKEANKELCIILNKKFFVDELSTKYHVKHVRIEVDQGVLLDGIFLQAKDSTKTVMLLSPNAAAFEFCFYQNFWIRFYLRRNVSVFIYNYRGYSESTGTQSPDVAASDGKAVFLTLQNNLKLIRSSEQRDFLFRSPSRTKTDELLLGENILVHAESIGGVVAASLAREFRSSIQLVVFDRNFSSLSITAGSLLPSCFGWIVKNFVGWETDNVRHFMTASRLEQGLDETDLEKKPLKPRLIVLCDPEDEIIANRASLKIGIARAVFAKKVGQQNIPDQKNICTKFNVLKRLRQQKEPSLPSNLPDIYVSLLDPTFSSRFAKCYLQIQIGLKTMLETKRVPRTSRLLSSFQMMTRLSSGGQNLYQAVSQFLIHTAQSKSAQEVLNHPPLLSTDDALHDWFKSFLSFGRDDPQMEGLLSRVVLVLERNKDEFSSLGLLSSVETLHKVFGLLKRALASSISMEKYNVALVPLQCGHNGMPGKEEITSFGEALKSVL